MRFFNAARAEVAAEQDAATTRLHAIRGRHTLTPSPLHNPPIAQEPAEPAWTPEPVGGEDDSEQPE